MKNFIVYDQTGKILRTGTCPDNVFLKQAEEGEFVIEGIANDLTQKISNPGIAGKVIDKTSEEIEADNLPPLEMSPGKKLAVITDEQWLDVLNKLDKLYKKFIKEE